MRVIDRRLSIGHRLRSTQRRQEGDMRAWALMLLVAAATTGCATSRPAGSSSALHVERMGAGPNVVVLLPGLLGSTRYWNGAGFDRLGSDFTVLLVDPLGFGRSSKLPSGYTVDDHLAALHAALRRNGATSNLTLVGHSFGGLLAIHYAARYPNEIDRLFLLGVPVFRGEADARERLSFMGGFARRYVLHPHWTRLVCGIHDVAGRLLRPLTRFAMRESPRAVAEHALLHTWRTLDGTVREVILAHPIEDVLPGVRADITYIHGARDRVTPLARIREVAACSGARVIETENDHRHYVGTATGAIIEALQAAVSTASRS